MSRIMGRRIYECPIYRDCPLVGSDGECKCYGYDLRVLKFDVARGTGHYLRRCPQYMREHNKYNDWKHDRETKRWDVLLNQVEV